MKNTNIVDLKKSLESLYLKKDYKKAINLLLENRDEFDLGLFHYNLGTLYAKQSEFAYARYNFEMAKKHGQIDTKNLNNLSVVKSHLDVKDITNSVSQIDKSMAFATSISKDVYITASLLLLVIVTFIWLKKKLNNYLSISLMIIFSLMPFLVNEFYLNKFKYAINLKKVEVYEGPSKVYDKKIDLTAGRKFLITGPYDGWYFIERPLLLSGWIEKKGFEIL